MTDSTWFYSLSTISQTLAAILGLAAIFVTLRLQGLIEKINSYKIWGIDCLSARNLRFPEEYKLPDIPKFSMSGVVKDLKTLVTNNTHLSINEITDISVRYLPGRRLNNKEFVTYVIDVLANLSDEKQAILKTIKLPSLLTSISILFSIFLIMLPDHNICLLITAFSLALLSIVSILRASWRILTFNE